MDKRIKWGIIGVIIVGSVWLGIRTFTPRENEELAEAELLPKESRASRALNVNAKIVKPHLLTDELPIIGRLVPDEEVDLSFETSGKIIDINFQEGTFVTEGQLLAKVNDSQLQVNLKLLYA